MNRMRLKQYEGAKWIDPTRLLIRLYEAQPLLQSIAKDDKELALENREHEVYRETREAALFCVGLQKLMNKEVKLLHDEIQDRDLVIGVFEEETMGLSDLQLKRIPPKKLNPYIDIETEIPRLLKKYVDSKDTVVAILISRNVEFDLNKIKIPEGVKLREVYVFGTIDPGQNTWYIYGDLCTEDRFYFEYQYPTKQA